MRTLFTIGNLRVGVIKPRYWSHHRWLWTQPTRLNKGDWGWELRVGPVYFDRIPPCTCS
jgi:hypothetical protein